MGSSGWKASSLTEPAWPGSLYRILLEVVSHTYTNLQQSAGEGRHGPRKTPVPSWFCSWNDLCEDKQELPRSKVGKCCSDRPRRAEAEQGGVRSGKNLTANSDLTPQGTEMDLKAVMPKKSFIVQGQGANQHWEWGGGVSPSQTAPNTLCTPRHPLGLAVRSSEPPSPCCTAAPPCQQL